MIAPLQVDSGIPYAVAAVLAFSTSSFLYRSLMRVHPPVWMNAFKATLAAVLFLGIFLFAPRPAYELHWVSAVVLLVSGLIGLNLSDWFMLRAYHRIGPARTIIVYRFQPLYLALLGFLVLGQTLRPAQYLAVFLLIGCVLVLSHENRRKLGHWDLGGILIALTAMILDGTGILLSRVGYEWTPGLDSNSANLMKAAGALAGFAVISRVHESIRLIERFGELKPSLKAKALIGSFFGCFLGLSLWLKALQHGNVATVSAVGGISPVIAVMIESALERRWPSRHAAAALVLSLTGFYLLVI